MLDLQEKLGVLIWKGLQGLFQGEECALNGSVGSCQATRLPARHIMLVRASVDAGSLV